MHNDYNRHAKMKCLVERSLSLVSNRELRLLDVGLTRLGMETIFQVHCAP